MLEGVELTVANAMSNAREAIKAYRIHGDISRLLTETTAQVGNPLKMAAYLMGHTDGLQEECDADDRLLSPAPVSSGLCFPRFWTRSAPHGKTDTNGTAWKGWMASSE